MRTTRRQALRTSLGSLCAVALTGRHQSLVAKDAGAKMRPLDYGRSFITHAASFNAVRFWVESRTRIFDPETGSQRDYYQCGSCKSEHTFAKKGLFNEDNYDFLPIISGENLLVFRRHARLTDRYRDVAKTTTGYWGPPTLKLRAAPQVKELGSWESIRDATAAALPVVAQTEVAHPDTGLRAIIEYPVKTMNISLDKKLYQVDTGPIAYPDLAKRLSPQIAALSLAFVAFNAPDFADFVVEQPTPVIEEGEEKCQILHYSSPFSLAAKNRLFVLED